MGTPQGLRYDGLYQTAEERHEGLVARGYLRYYAEGTVLSVTSTGTAAQVIEWLTPRKEDISVGVWRLEGEALRFECTSPQGTVDYEGRVVDEAHLELRWHSHINGHRAAGTYEFIPVQATGKRPKGPRRSHKEE